MGHHAIEVLRQGVWASLTGGWFYDPHLNLFSNTFHLYLWMFFLITPFVIKLTVHHSSQLLAWSLYCVLVAIVFIVIKIVNYKLHTLFDTTEKIAAPATDSQTNDSWPRAQSGSPSSNERIELEIIRNHSNTRDSRRTSPLENATVKAPNTGVTTVDVEAQTSAVAGASLDAASATVPTILSLDDITSMEDITSLEDLHLEELKTVAPSGTPENSPDRVKNFRRTVKAMSTQVTPQTSPLVGYKRRALSQERWPVPLIASSTPPTLKRQQPHYHSQRVTRRRNMTYSRRRSKSVLDSPHGSHMLVGESRAEEQPPLTLEWAGYPHPSPRPRVRLRQMSLEEPLSGCSSRRYSFDTKPSQRERKRERRTATAKSSNVLMRTNSERLEDINVLRDSLLNNAHRRKISTVSEPADPFGESDSSDSESNEKCRPINRCQVKSSHRHIADVDTGDEHKQETSSNVLSGVLNLAREIESETMTGAGGDVKEEMAVNLTNRRTEINKGAIGDEVSSSNINACNNSEIKTDSDSDTEPAASPSDSKLKASSDSTESTNTAPPLSVVEEITELERPRNPTPTTASSARDAARAGGAIPKTGAKYEAFRERFRHVSADDTALNPHDKSTVVSSASNNSSMSGLENASLLITPKPKAKRKVEEITLANDQSSILLKRRPAVRRHTTAEDRSRVRRARYYGSGSSRASRSSSHRHSYSEAESSHTQPRLHTPPPDTEDGWHYFQDSEGCWYKYTFDSTSDGLPIKMGKDFTPGSVQGDTAAPGDDSILPQDSADAAQPHNILTLLASNQDDNLLYRSGLSRRRLAGLGIGNILMRQRSNWSADTDRRDSEDSSDTTIRVEPPVSSVSGPKQFYKWKMFSMLPSVKIWLDRLSLLALLDRNVSRKENIASVFLAILVTVMASILLATGYYKDIFIFFFCFVVAGCQYSLLKSVQPDAASPTHGYNNVIIYSRGFYFCLLSILIIVVDVCARRHRHFEFTLYGLTLVNVTLLEYSREVLKVLMLCQPLVFLLGLLPQVNTFLQYLLEQVEIHIFGGNGTTSLLSALYAVLHSLLAVAVLYGLAFVPIELIGRDASKVDEVSSSVAFSVFSALLVSISYHYSRLSSDPSHLWMLIKSKCQWKDETDAENSQSDESIKDPLPGQIRKSIYQRLRNDLIVCVVLAIFMFGIHVSTVFSAVFQPLVNNILCYITMAVGFLTHYVFGQLRKEYPWLCCSHPFLKTPEREQFNITGPATITWFEKLYVSLRFFEKNLLYPAVFLSGLSLSTPAVLNKFGVYVGPLVLVICSFKSLRSSYSDATSHYCVLSLTQFAFNYDYARSPERDMFVLNYALMLIFYSKFVDFYLKCKFIFVYIAPWQLAWGSAFHAFAQPLSVPHACMLFVQAALSALLYTPLNPFLGSAVFLNSYMRPIKFWERDYNTKRVDHSNIRLASQVDSNLGTDDNNLNSIFYEHLTRSLQKSLCGDLMMGRWGEAHQGDMFIMASEYLNALVHIVEMGNGLVTFQLRGLEFRGTYCQQREVEAITEGVEDDKGFCCCSPGQLPHFLSVNAAFGERWLAWEVTVTMYVLNGYSITDNNAAGMLQVYDLRKVLITYYVKSVIFYTIRSSKLAEWIKEDGITSNIDTNEDMASVFSPELDEDFDRIAHKLTQRQFSRVYLTWIHYCLSKSHDPKVKLAINYDAESRLIRLCYALSLVARRALATAAHNNCASVNVEFFLHGLHSLFKGDFRITGPDEWIFNDMELLRKVISPAIRMALKLHQDHFSLAEENSDNVVLYSAMLTHIRELVITHEADPDWRNAVLANRPSLLALRHVFDEGSNLYKIIMLNKRHLSFRIIKVNRECVRGLWAGQQQELVFLRNRNPERGSIQNAKQALRNMINSSCDQPIGYPIYVSPLTTSYAGTNQQLTSALVLLAEVSLKKVRGFFTSLWNNLNDLPCALACRYMHPRRPRNRHHSYAVNSQQTSLAGGDAMPSYPTVDIQQPSQHIAQRPTETWMASRSGSRQPPTSKQSSSSLPLALVGGFSRPGSTAKEKEKLEPSADSHISAQQETSFSEPGGAFAIGSQVWITDASCVMSNLNRQRRPDPAWPSTDAQKNGGASGWSGWIPKEEMQGEVFHKWIPCHSDIRFRSNIDKTIYLVKIGQYFVPITEQGITAVEPD